MEVLHGGVGKLLRQRSERGSVEVLVGSGLTWCVRVVQVHVTRRPSSAVIVEFLKSARSIACRWVGRKVEAGCRE